MAVLGPGDPAKIIFMEGYDGAAVTAGAGDGEQMQWTVWRMWQTGNMDPLSPSNMGKLTGSGAPQYFDGAGAAFPGDPGNHSPQKYEICWRVV